MAVLKKLNIQTETYEYINGYLIDIVTPSAGGDGYCGIYLYHTTNRKFKSLLFELHESEYKSEENLLTAVDTVLRQSDYLEHFNESYMLLDSGKALKFKKKKIEKL